VRNTGNTMRASTKTPAGYKTRAWGEAHVRRILSVSEFPADHTSLRCAFNNQSWQVEEALTYQQAVACLCRARADVVICDCHLPDGTWKDLLGHIAAIPDPPALIVSSSTGDEHIATEVRALGGYGVLKKPFKVNEVQAIVFSAWQAGSGSVAVA
jgi:two-component system, OmpR family, KDP operon response regulator KdpE